MNWFKTFILLWLPLSCLIGQNLEERLSVAVVNCETVSVNAQNLMATYSIEDVDSIKQVLKFWRSKCGDSEVISRVEVLMDLYYNRFRYEDHRDYFRYRLSRFLNRVDNAGLPNSDEVFESNRSYFNYVKINGVFDQWTRDIAQQIQKESSNQNLDAYLATILFTFDLETFEAEMQNQDNRASDLVKDYLSKYDYSRPYQVSIYLGARIPLVNQRIHFHESPQLGFGLSIPIKGTYSAGFKVIFTRLINQKDLLWNIENDSVLIDPPSIVTAGFNFSRRFVLRDKSLSLDLYSGINLGALSTSIDKEGDDEDNPEYAAETVDLEVGFNLGKTIFTNKEIGLNVSFHYAPYNLDSELITEVGSLYGQVNSYFKF
jgi:hypothetical protein